MANPVTIGGIGLGASAAGALTGAAGSIFGGEAQAAQANYQANVARINAKIAQQDADYARAAGETEAQQVGMRGRAQEAAIRTGVAAGNLDIHSGSAAQVLKSQTALTQFDEATTRANAAKRAWGFETERAGEIASAGAYDIAARTARTAADFGAASTLIGGAGQVSSKWLQGKSVGLWG